MTPLITMKRARIMAISLCGCFLLIHTLLLFFFQTFGVRPMVWFNFFSIVFYIVMILVVRRSLSFVFPVLVFAEVVLHMTSAAFFTGWESGFQIPLIGSCVLIFYCEYIGSVLKIRRIRSVPLSLVGMVFYVLCCIACHHWPAPYPLPESVQYWLQIYWGVVVFLIMIVFMYIFVQLTTRSETYLSNAAGKDKLTGLNNRYFLSDYMKKLESEHRLERCWVSMMDIDDFKKINDTHGHLFGDYVLKTLAAILESEIVDAEVCRWGGEEFLITGYIDRGMEMHLARLEHFRKTVEAYDFTYEGTTIHLTITIGVAAYRPGQTIEEWVASADQKLYEGKNSGKNKVVF